MTGRVRLFLGALAAKLAFSLVFALGACHAKHPTAANPDPARAELGKAAIARAQCGSCHVIPGVANATGEVGPPLTGFARRTIIAGMLPNSQDNLTRWLLDPQSVVPGNAMPATGLTQREARDAAVYLATLR